MTASLSFYNTKNYEDERPIAKLKIYKKLKNKMNKKINIHVLVTIFIYQKMSFVMYWCLLYMYTRLLSIIDIHIHSKLLTTRFVDRSWNIHG